MKFVQLLALPDSSSWLNTGLIGLTDAGRIFQRPTLSDASSSWKEVTTPDAASPTERAEVSDGDHHRDRPPGLFRIDTDTWVNPSAVLTIKAMKADVALMISDRVVLNHNQGVLVIPTSSYERAQALVAELVGLCNGTPKLDVNAGPAPALTVVAPRSNDSYGAVLVNGIEFDFFSTVTGHVGVTVSRVDVESSSFDVFVDPTTLLLTGETAGSSAAAIIRDRGTDAGSDDETETAQKIIDAISRHSRALDNALGEAVESMEKCLRLREEIDAKYPSSANCGWGCQSKGYPDHTLADFYRVAAQVIHDIKCNATEAGGGVNNAQIDRLQRLMDAQLVGRVVVMNDDTAGFIPPTDGPAVKVDDDPE